MKRWCPRCKRAVVVEVVVPGLECPRCKHVTENKGRLEMATLVGRESWSGERPHFRVWASRNGLEMDFYAVESPEEAMRLIDKLARKDLRDPHIAFNVFGLEELEDDNEYHEWYNEDGQDIDDLSGEREECDGNMVNRFLDKTQEAPHA